MQPTIVFIAQLGTGGDSWQPVLDRLTCGSPTFTYDRPGTGNAPPRPAPNPPLPYRAFAAELEDELAAAGVTGPLVLVGHSVGDLIARVFASRNLDRVVGMVHVDGSFPRMWITPDECEERLDGDGPDATVIDTIAGEIDILDAQVPRVPSVVLTRPVSWWYGPMPHPEAGELWVAHQRHLARTSGAPLVIVPRSGHQIPAEAPEVVSKAVDAVVASVAEERGTVRWACPPTAATS